MNKALLRGIPDSYRRAITGERGRMPDVALARAQHDRYRAHVEEAGFRTQVLDADEAHPDCVFIEDTAVVIGDVGIVTRPGSPSRVGEIGPVAVALAADLHLAAIEPPGTLDGGDVMVVGDRIWVGLSDRTNSEGAAQLASLAADRTVVAVPVTGVLHLKSAVLPVAEDTVVVTPGTVDESLLDGLRILHEDREERHRFSALRLGGAKVLVTSAAPRTAEQLDALGLEIVPIEASEILAADGGLTCLSILY